MITPRFISDLLGAPMAAVVQAEAIAARATADFIKEVGFSNSGDATSSDYGSVRNISFTYNRINPDGTSQVASITVPLLTIIPIPSLRVAEAEIEFDLALTQPDTSTTGGGTSSSSNQLFDLRNQLKLKGILAKKPAPNAPTTSTTANMSVKIKLAQAEPTIGMVQLLNILDSAKKE